jgi:hypothetical protein
MRILVPAALLQCASGSAPAWCQDAPVAPTGDASRKVDVRLLEESVQILNEGTQEQKEERIAQILAAPASHAPPVLVMMSRVLFDSGKKDEAGFWFYAGQLRARFDANRCADESARSAVSVLNEEFGPRINEYMFRDLVKLESVVRRVVEWDRKTPHDYDPRWINLHGMTALLGAIGDQGAAAKSMSLPKEQWPEIAEKTRREYLEGFAEALEEMKRQGKPK